MKAIVSLLLLLASLPALADRVVTDELGRTVTVPDHPHRIVCLLPSVVDDVYSLGAGADVVAVSDYTKYPAEAKSKPSVGSSIQPSLEAIVALHPDLILASGQMRGMEAVGGLEKLGIPLFLVDPHGVEGIYKSIASIGDALNRQAAASELNASLHRREEAIRARVRGAAPVRVLMPIWYDPIMTIGAHAYITEMIEIAGGQSVTSDIPQEWPQVSLEAVLARAPEALLLIKGSKLSLDTVRTRPGWADLPAVRNNRIYYVGDEINLDSPVAFDALEELAREFHP